MIALEEAERRDYRNNLYYFCRFSVSLKLFQGNKLYLKKRNGALKGKIIA